MRRSITTVISLVAAFASGACEDGPSQTFSAAPTGAANVWNGQPAGVISPDAGLFVSPATQGYDAAVSGQGQNANDLCTPPQEKAVWTANFNMPIIANPGLGAGLDLAGGPMGGGIARYNPSCLSDTSACDMAGPGDMYHYDPATVEPWTGITLDQAQALLCQALQPASPFGPSSQQGWAGWGESDEVNVFYNINNRQITDLFFFPGYIGNLVGTCEPHVAAKGAIGDCATETVYTISMQANDFMQVQASGTPPWPNAADIKLVWNTNPNTNTISNQIYEALRQTYLPNFPSDVDCVAAGHCIIDNNLTDDGILFFTPFNLAIFVANTVATTPAGTSIPIFIQVGVTKLLPFSDAEVTLKLDKGGIGPVAYASPTSLGLPAQSTTSCTYQIGMLYGSPSQAGSFEADCVQPYTNSGLSNGADLDNAAQAKLVGAIAHSDEDYAFDIQGVDPQFTATLGLTEVIADGQLPSAADIAFQLNIDQFVLGPIANDYTDNDSTKPKDWHGIGILTFLWAYEVHQFMSVNYGVNTDLGDPYCIANLFGGAPLRPGSLGGGSGSGSGSGGGAADGGDGEGGASDAGPPPSKSCSFKSPCSGETESCQAGTGGFCGSTSTKCTCQPKVCSGLEGITTTAPTTLVPADHPTWANNMLGAAGTTVNTFSFYTDAPNPACTTAQVQANDISCVANGLAVGLKPGTWYSLFCQDAGGTSKSLFPKGYTQCLGGEIDPLNQYNGFYFDTMLQAVSNSYGSFPNQPAGPLAVPDTLNSRRFYFQEWMLAFVKYLQTADVPTTPIETIYANTANPDEFFFDPLGGGFEDANYVFRGNVNAQGQAPTQLNIATNLQTSVINNFAFTRHNYRGESAIYAALLDTPTDKAGAETIFIQNMVGSPALQEVYGTIDCADSATAAGCQGFVPPVDPLTGKSIFAPYADAFGTSIFHIPAAGQPQNNSELIVDSKSYELIQSALVTTPVYFPAYGFPPADSTKPCGTAGACGKNGLGVQEVCTGNGVCSAPGNSVQELLPYLSGAGVGFEVTVDGSRDKFYNTQNIDFSGATISASVDFETVATGGDGGTGQQTVIRAIETGNYLGLVFPCFEINATDTAYDILAVRMYDNADSVLDWITAHPAAVSDCGIQIKYSIYGNYADYITFGVNPGYPIGGYRFGLNAGYGGSVIADVTIFDPNIVASLGQ